MGDYRKYLVWQQARVLSARIERLVATLPADVRRRIGDQIIRSAHSVRFNIVEGAGLNSDPQLARCLLLSLGSANEVQDQLDTLEEGGHLNEKDRELIAETTELRAKLAVFQRKVAGTPRPPKKGKPKKKGVAKRRPPKPSD